MSHALLTILQYTYKEDDGHAMSENNVNYKQYRAAKEIYTNGISLQQYEHIKP
jgi:hypothetical protein